MLGWTELKQEVKSVLSFSSVGVNIMKQSTETIFCKVSFLHLLKRLQWLKEFKII